jgi:uncharacterized glyoxalase superfamily protein PhnB
MTTYSVRKVTPVLVVPSVEPSLAFWEDRLGFTRTAEVPHDGAIGFAIVVKDGAEVMLQSEASVRADLGSTTATLSGTSAALFVEVSDLDVVERAVSGEKIEMPRRRTFYGMDEIGVREPGGHFVIFAQPAAS